VSSHEEVGADLRAPRPARVVASRAAEAEGTVLEELKSVGLLLKLVLGRWVFDRGDDYKWGYAGATRQEAGLLGERGVGCREGKRKKE